MAIFDEPKDQAGASQIIDSQADEGNRSKAWLNTKDSTSKRKVDGWLACADAVIWLSGAGLFARVILVLNYALEIGMLPQTPLIFALIIAVWVIVYSLSSLSSNNRFYRLVLFLAGILLAIL